ncbi:MAG: hypothetical protein JOS17DRAFT_749158 [Linnemannia elongata]|nr:MAG: hypothetical protein JOS17DRAFT_749158 [Linnemannia elongata]
MLTNDTATRFRENLGSLPPNPYQIMPNHAPNTPERIVKRRTSPSVILRKATELWRRARIMTRKEVKKLTNAIETKTTTLQNPTAPLGSLVLAAKRRQMKKARRAKRTKNMSWKGLASLFSLRSCSDFWKTSELRKELPGPRFCLGPLGAFCGFGALFTISSLYLLCSECLLVVGKKGRGRRKERK